MQIIPEAKKNLFFLNKESKKIYNDNLKSAILFRPFDCIAHKTLNYFAFQSFDFESTWWLLFQKHVLRTKLDIQKIHFETLYFHV
jgi:hypothetical protein